MLLAFRHHIRKMINFLLLFKIKAYLFSIAHAQMCQVYDQKCRKSWLIGHNATFVHRTVEHPYPDLLHHFFAIQARVPPLALKDEQASFFLCHWTVEESDLKNMAKKEFLRGPIHSLLFENALKELVIVFLSGEIMIVDADLNEVATMTPEQFVSSKRKYWSSVVLYADITRLENNFYLFLLMEYNNGVSSSSSSSLPLSVASASSTTPTERRISSHCLQLELFVFKLQQKSKSSPHMILRLLSSYYFNPTQENECVAAAAFDIQTLTLALFWNTEKLSFYNFETRERLCNEKSDGPQNGDAFLTLTRSLRAFQIQSENSQKGVHALFWQPGLMLLAGKKLREPNESLILVWDTSRAVVLHSKSVSLDVNANSAPPHSATENVLLQICKGRDNNFVALCFTYAVFICPMNVLTPDLATVCGRIRYTKQNVKFSDPLWRGPPLTVPNINLKEKLEELTQCESRQNRRKSKVSEVTPQYVHDEKWNRSISKLQKEEKIVITQLNELRHGRLTKEKFLKLFNDYIQKVNGGRFDLSKHSFLPESLGDDFIEFNPKKHNSLDHWLSDIRHRQRLKAISRERKMQNRITPLSQTFIKEVCRLCLRGENPSEYILEPIATLLAIKQISVSSTVRELVPALIVARRFDLIVDVLLTIDDVIEFDLLLLLKFFISAVPLSELQQFWLDWEKNNFTTKKEKITATNSDTESSVEVTVTPDKALDRFLNLIVTVPSNDVFVQQSLKSLNIHEVMVFLRYVLRWLATYRGTPIVTDIRQHIAIPSLSQILKWATMIIDTHIASLILVEECNELLFQLQSAVKEHIHYCEELQNLKGCINYYFNTYVISEQSVPDYSIEFLEL